MKYLIRIFVFIFFVSNSIQGDIGSNCNFLGLTQDRWDSYNNSVGFLNNSILQPYDPSSPIAPVYQVGIALHIITDNAGNQGIDPDTLQADLNLLFASFYDQVKIDFILVQQDTIANDAYVSTTLAEEDLISENYNVFGVVNIYYIPDPSGSKNGHATFSPVKMGWFNQWNSCNISGQYVIIGNDRQYISSLTHEMGHYFDLFHTYETSLGIESIDNLYKSGDLVPDTPIAHDGVEYECDSSNPDRVKLAKNFMSASTPSQNCRSEFTSIQRQYIRYCLVNRRNNHLLESIQLSNIIASQNAGGNLQATQSSITQTVPSRNFAGLRANQNAAITTLDERFENWQASGVTYKHHNWNEVNTEHFLERSFTVTSDEHQFAWFTDFHPAQIDLNLISGGSGGTIDFHDPWFLESDGTQPETLFPSIPLMLLPVRGIQPPVVFFWIKTQHLIEFLIPLGPKRNGTIFPTIIIFGIS